MIRIPTSYIRAGLRRSLELLARARKRGHVKAAAGHQLYADSYRAELKRRGGAK